MFCSNCGAEINDNAKFCPKCGKPVTPYKETGQDSSDQDASFRSSAQDQQSQQQEQQQYQYQDQQQYQHQNTGYQGSYDGKGIASLILGIVGIILSFILLGGGIMALIMGIIGIILAAMSRRDIGGTGVSTAGLVFSIIALILGLRGILCIAIVGAACSAML